MLGGMSVVTSPLPARTVAGNVRAELARIGMPAYKLPASIGGTRSYWGRRMTGELSFSVDDLLSLAGLCRVHPGIFFDGVEGPPSPKQKVGGSNPSRRANVIDMTSRLRPSWAEPSSDRLAQVLVLR